MAHLWRSSDDGLWKPVALDGAGLALAPSGPLAGDTGEDLSPGDASMVLLRRTGRREAGEWVLVAGPDSRLSVNGLPVDLGIVVLRDRDEIRWPSATPLYFSTEQLAAVVPYPDGTRGFCPRCKDPIQAGQPAVRCPGCGLWHHATDERPCWSYDVRCAACPQPTATDAGFWWTPEEL